jgi:hypothetical protein
VQEKKPSGQVDLRLSELKSRELVELYKQIGRALARGGKPDLAQRIREIEAEVDRRICRSDPEMDAIGVEILRAGELKLVPPLPTEIENLAPEYTATLKNRELTARFGQCKRVLAFDVQTYPKLSDVQDWLARRTLIRRREKLEAAIRCVAHEMMRRGLVPKRADAWKAEQPKPVNPAANLTIIVRQPIPGQPNELSQAPSTGAVAAKKEPARNAAKKRYEPDPNVWQRRQLVRQNPKLDALNLCGVFDSRGIRLPRDWENEFKVKTMTWVHAYRIPKARARIQRIISTDRNHS